MRRRSGAVSLPPDWLTRILFGLGFILVSFIFTIIGIFPMLSAKYVTNGPNAVYVLMFMCIVFFAAGVGNLADGLTRPRARLNFRMPEAPTVNADSTVPVESQAKLVGTVLQDVGSLYILAFRVFGLLLVFITSFIFAVGCVVQANAAIQVLTHPATALLAYLAILIVAAVFVVVLMLVSRKS